MNSELIAEIKKIIPEENILENEPMSRHTMFRVGGPADCFVRITQAAQLTQLVKLLHRELEMAVICLFPTLDTEAPFSARQVV